MRTLKKYVQHGSKASAETRAGIVKDAAAVARLEHLLCMQEDTLHQAVARTATCKFSAPHAPGTLHTGTYCVAHAPGPDDLPAAPTTQESRRKTPASTLSPYFRAISTRWLCSSISRSDISCTHDSTSSSSSSSWGLADSCTQVGAGQTKGQERSQVTRLGSVLVAQHSQGKGGGGAQASASAAQASRAPRRHPPPGCTTSPWPRCPCANQKGPARPPPERSVASG